MAKNNAIKEVDVYPTRGLIYDRFGELIVFNEPIYDLMVTPRLAKNFDTAKLCELLNIQTADFYKKWDDMKKQRSYSSRRHNVFFKQISQRDYSRLQEFMNLSFSLTDIQMP